MRAPDERDSARGRERLRGNSGRVGWSGSRRAAYRRKGKDAPTKLVMLTRIGARLAVLTIVVLSAVPGKIRSRILGDDYCEHFRSVSGRLLATGYLRPCRCCRAACSPYARLIGGHSIVESAGSQAPAVGAWIGLLIMIVVRRAHDASLLLPINRPNRFAELQRERRLIGRGAVLITTPRMQGSPAYGRSIRRTRQRVPAPSPGRQVSRCARGRIRGTRRRNRN